MRKTKQDKIRWLQAVECRLYYELENTVDTAKHIKYNKVKALLDKMVTKYN